MQFNFDCERALGCDTEGVSVLEGSFESAIKPGYLPFVNQIIDSMGFNSSKAQGLTTIITSSAKFFASNQRIFIKSQGNTVIGILKVGVKKLFIRDSHANYHEISPLCVLDFYVHESQQRGGHGKILFEYMLKFENIQPKILAYDRPSPKLLGFLKKHYGLNQYIPQNNNYVVFNDYFLNNSQSIKNPTTVSTRRKKEIGNYSENLGNINQSNNLNNFNSTNLSHISHGSKQSQTNSQLANIGQKLVGDNTTNNSHLNNMQMEIGSQNGNIQNFNEENFLQNNLINQNIKNNNNNIFFNHSSNTPTPNKVFAEYYLNNQNTNYYDGIYSKKKLNLLNDYLKSPHLQPDEFVKQQLKIKSKEIYGANDRLRQLETNIHNTPNQVNFYNKRNEYSTIFDDKKILEKKILHREDSSSSQYQNNSQIHNQYSQMSNLKMQDNLNNENLNIYNEFNRSSYNPHRLENQVINFQSHRTPVKTNILPTTSSSYGAYYSHNDLSNNFNRNIYY